MSVLGFNVTLRGVISLAIFVVTLKFGYPILAHEIIPEVWGYLSLPKSSPIFGWNSIWALTHGYFILCVATLSWFSIWRPLSIKLDYVKGYEKPRHSIFAHLVGGFMQLFLISVIAGFVGSIFGHPFYHGTTMWMSYAILPWFILNLIRGLRDEWYYY